MTSPRSLRIGISASVFHEDRSRTVFHGKPLYYVERGLVRYVGGEGAVAYLVPGTARDDEALAYAADLDGLVLSGGVDVAPRMYGEAPARPDWAGDAVRDRYELALVRAMFDADKPILGICRGHQLLNVYLGGSLYQDVTTMVPGAIVHRDAEVYDALSHPIDIEPGSWLSNVYGGITRATVTSVHHQAIKRLGRGVVVEARSPVDGVIEAVRVDGPRWVRGVQWHPEWTDPGDRSLLDPRPLYQSFLAAVRARRD
ncbi:MAG TPA: gamma-glutamyl-gamma-aminobutyrate hydrolase family protein [Kofleriaceae bacterium]|nr:gamma-glutamyl-gamma-aminobutyrate hydrolase family protein [Kofleriaceae bacterium]